MNKYGDVLLQFRAEHGMTQKVLADILGVSPNMVFRYESGKSDPSKVNKIKFDMKIKEWKNKNANV